MVSKTGLKRGRKVIAAMKAERCGQLLVRNERPAAKTARRRILPGGVWAKATTLG
jgi:hypothetical protein